MSVNKPVRIRKNLVSTLKFVRNPQWISNPLDSIDEKTSILFALFEDDLNCVSFRINTTGVGVATVDWGDGTSSTGGNNTVFSKSYNFSDFSNDTLTSAGYKQVIITITNGDGMSVTDVDFKLKHPLVTNITNPVCNILEVKQSGTLLNFNGFNTDNSNTTPAVEFPMFENYEMLNGILVSGKGGFSGVTSLKRIFFNVSNAAPSIGAAFLRNCSSLLSFEVNNPIIANGISTVVDASNLVLQNFPKVILKTSNMPSNGALFSNCTLSQLDVTINNYNSSGPFILSNTSVDELTININTESFTQSGFINFHCPNSRQLNLNLNGVGNSLAWVSQAGGPNTRFKDAFVNLLVDGASLNVPAISRLFVKGNKKPSLVSINASYLEYLDPIDTSNATSISFQNSYWSELPYFDCFSANSINITGCSNIVKFPNWSWKTSGDMTVTLLNCSSLIELPAFYSTNLNVNNCRNLRRIRAYGMHAAALNISNSKLKTEYVNELIENLGIPTASRTLTITNCIGALESPNITRSSTTTSGSTTVACSNTASFVTGMQVTGTGISDAVSVTFSASADTVTRTNHGLPNGKRVSFTAITTTTGISIFTPYYVVNATADTFQLSLTEGGAPINLVNNGTGTMIYQTLITAINPNVSVTIDVAASASGTNNLNYRNINTQIAVMKRWAVTG